MGTGIPLLNEYKQEFLSKRFPQTLLGGPKLRLGYDAPVYVYFNQLLLFLFPFLIGGIFTLLVELKIIEDYVGGFITGSLIFTFVLIVQLTSTIVQAQNSADIPYPTKKNLLGEEDEVDFFSCCGVETFEFVVPKKRFRINIIIHSILSALVSGSTFIYLLPTTLNSLYSSNTGATVVLYIFGWLTLCIAQYSLTVGAPPEPNAFRTQDSWELGPLMRSLYVLICTSVYLLNRYNSSVFNTADQALHIVFACLPIAWITGLLPPVDAFLLWLFEQIHVSMLGGSPVASDLRLLILLVISITVFLAAYFIQKSLATVIICALMGYFLSLDLGAAANHIYRFLVFRNKVSSSSGSMDVTSQTSKLGFLWRFGILQCLYHVIMMVIVGVLSGLLNSNSDSLDSNTWKLIGYSIIGCCVAEKITRDLQNVYLFFGLWRNFPWIYPMRRRSYITKRKRLRILGGIRRVLVNWVSPLLMLSYLSVLIPISDPDTVSLTSGMSTSRAVWYTFGTVRAFRWIWQGTVSSLLELSIIHIILVTIPNNSTVLLYGVPILSLLVGLSRDRFFQFLNKLYFAFTLLITSISDKKQRRKSTIPILVLSIIFFPVILGIIGVATVLSAPLLSLFTLPVFFIGFPRPNKFWPEAVGASASSNPDTMFYMQVAPKLSQTLRAAFADGSLDEAVPGHHYLVRFQDRLIWVMVLERGYGFCSVSIKGLELQETSCHTAEAARIDEIFETAFEKENASCLGYINEFPMHTLTPMDSTDVEAYSDARNVLTGIIDYPANYDIVMTGFIKALIWVLLRHVNQIKLKEGKKKNDEHLGKISQNATKNEKLEMIEFKRESNNNVSNGLHRNLRNSNNAAVITKKGTLPPIQTTVDVIVDKDNRSSVRPPTARSAKRKSSWSSLNSFTDSIFSEDGLFNEKKPPKKEIKRPVVSNRPVKSGGFDDDIDVLDDMLEDLDFGLPAMDINQRSKVQSLNNVSKAPLKKNMSSNGNAIYKPVTNLAGSPDFKCPHSAQISLPTRWRELPLDYSQLSRYLSKFPQDWYRHVLSTLDWSNTGQTTQQVLGDVSADDALLNCYSQLIMACYSIFDSNGSIKSPSQLYKFYIGDLPWNAMLDWLSEDRQLHNLVLRSYRYGFKLMLDQILLGEANSPEEIQEYFEEYDKDWYIGLETDEEWKAAVLSSRKQLFSLGQNKAQNTYNSRVLSLQPVMAHIGRMNPEVVKGQWANLSMELLYMTNDDEERYSIQAHPTILRNLTVQSADPPLGYPIFSSEPISIPTL